MLSCILTQVLMMPLLLHVKCSNSEEGRMHTNLIKKIHIRRSTTSDTMNLLATGGPAFVCCVGPVFLCRVRTAFLRSLLTFLCSVRSRRISHTCATLKERVPLRLSMLGYDCRSGESSASSSKDVELCAKGDQPGSHPMTCNSVCCLASSKDCQQMSLMSPYSV